MLTKVIAHRGASGERPEHTLGAYQLALAAGVDAVEPDVVPSKDGVLVIRHEPNIGLTTDVAAHREFADRQTTKLIDGLPQRGWFTEDFTWSELSTLRCVERIPSIRPANAVYDGQFPILRLRDLLALLDEDPLGQQVTPVIEIKHPTTMLQQGFDMATLLMDELKGTPFGTQRPVIIECFELSVLLQLRHLGLDAEYVMLIEQYGVPFDEFSRLGTQGAEFRAYLKHPAIDVLADLVDGVSLRRTLILPDKRLPDGEPKKVVQRVQDVGLALYAWTLRPENRFLPSSLRIGHDPQARGDWQTLYRRMFNLGLAGVFVDNPSDLREVLVPEDAVAVPA